MSSIEPELDAEGRFSRDIPKADHVGVKTIMSEAAAYGDHADIVTILERDQLDPVNVRALGVITWKGREHSFDIECGNRIGFALLGWNDDRDSQPDTAKVWALQPKNATLCAVQTPSQAKTLLRLWAIALEEKPTIASIPEEYTRDLRERPGEVTKAYWAARAGIHGFDIVSEVAAKGTRGHLTRIATLDDIPTPSIVAEAPSEPALPTRGRPVLRIVENHDG